MNPESKLVRSSDSQSVEKSSNPISLAHIGGPKKSANRLYGGYNKQQFFSNQINNVDALDIITDFCSNISSKKNIEDVLFYLHHIVINKLNYNFSAVGFINSSGAIDVKLVDRISNVFSTKVFAHEASSPVAQCINEKKEVTVGTTAFLNINYLQNSPALLLPIVEQGRCIGIFIVGMNVANPHNNRILNILVNYASTYMSNLKLLAKVKIGDDRDPLTNLMTHRVYQETLRHELKQAQENETPLSIAVLDIQNIWTINRDYGFSRGDEVIKTVAKTVEKAVAGKGFAARYGGDEIAIILPNHNHQQAMYVVEYINHALSCCMVDDVGAIKASFGIASFPSCSRTQEKLLIQTEQALMMAKHKSSQDGKSNIVSANDFDFWSETALDSFAAVITKKHAQFGINFEEELVDKLHRETITSNSHLIETITSLAGAIDAKDTYTKGHSMSVSRYAEALARALELPQEEVERIKLGALVHDVGKIGIPESVLTKPDRLSDDEWEIMKQHPVIGAEKVIEPIESLKHLIPMVKHHHEHWDGSGYPCGLRGEEIPLDARIVSVADAFHALISDRPYRKGLSLEKSLEILKCGAGIQWDKTLVRKFIVIAPSLYNTF